MQGHELDHLVDQVLALITVFADSVTCHHTWTYLQLYIIFWQVIMIIGIVVIIVMSYMYEHRNLSSPLFVLSTQKYNQNCMEEIAGILN